jgi:hypothetical protein
MGAVSPAQGTVPARGLSPIAQHRLEIGDSPRSGTVPGAVPYV